MAKINLDKYYTPTKIAKHCIDTVWQKVPKITEVIEPSAGNGAFSLQIPNCIAYDLCPEHGSIIKQDFLKLDLSYKRGRAFIGNPPFGTRNTLSIKFFKKAITMGDTIAFILPISQYQNTQQMYKFDLIHSEMLPIIKYSGIEVHCCFNIYTRPKNGLNKAPINYTLKDVTVLEYRRGGTYPKPTKYDFGMCAWGSSIGKEVKFVGKYAQENYIVVNNEKYKQQILELMKTTNWKTLYPYISTPKIQTWKIYKYLREQIPQLI